MFGYPEAATDLMEQAPRIERVQASFCDSTSLFPPTDERRTGKKEFLAGHDSADEEVRLASAGKAPSRLLIACALKRRGGCQSIFNYNLNSKL
jgi:hypothetical protein